MSVIGEYTGELISHDELEYRSQQNLKISNHFLTTMSNTTVDGDWKPHQVHKPQLRGKLQEGSSKTR